MDTPNWRIEYHYRSAIGDAINDELRARIQAYLADKAEALLTEPLGKEPEPTSYGVSASHTGFMSLYNLNVS